MLRSSTITNTPAGAELTTVLRSVRAQWFRLVALRVAARVMVCLAMILGVAAVLERAATLPDPALLVFAGVTAAVALGATAVLVLPLRRRPDHRQVARYLEERFPDCDDAIVSAVDVEHATPDDHGFAALVIRAACSRLRTLDLSQVVDRREQRLARWRTAASATALILAVVLSAPFVERTAQVAYLRLFPGSITVTVTPGNVRVPIGRPVTIAASVAGHRGNLSRVVPVVTLEAGGQRTSVPMERTAAGYVLRIASVDRSFQYKVAAGPAASQAYSVTALHAPRVQRIELHYDYPPFTGLKPREEHDGGDVYGPAGTRVRLIVHTDKPVNSGKLTFGDGKGDLALARSGDRALESTLTVREEAAYRVGLVDGDGLTSEGIEYFVRVMDDRPPEVHILRPNGDEQITPLQEVPIEARADDDFGIASFDMVYSVGGGAETAVPFTTLSGTDIARIGARMLAVEDLRVKPGDVIAYYARARDVARAKRSTLARSEIFFLEVKPFNEEYVMAQSQAGAGAGGTQLDSLIAAQKEIISATWNLERRAGAGRSSTDIKGIADAQAELKGRAEQAAGARPRRRIGQELPQQVSAPLQTSPAGDPVRDAVDAMTRALQHLHTEKTADAIPHEMAALNALLQAQAEIRRRQLSQQQQQSNGGGFGNRQTQDLSNLFDRELKRQQKTNYESKAEVETHADDRQSESALDKIRDLARRQEDLNRQQRELARSGMSAEELKRQLEKLTRDQEELRRQAEAAAGEIAKTSKGAEGGRSGSAKGADAASNTKGAQSDVKSALEQMREAASQLQNADARGAAAKGEEAARALRKAESQMQNGSPDAQRRALGDLQLESQQLAEAQRRVAGEAGRLDREGGGAADARRRLAAEKEQLADRVDALRSAAQRMPSAAEAGRQLGDAHVGERMRAGAQRLRDASAGGKIAPDEQQLADALDAVARKMNAADAGGAKGGSQQLANELDELRAARERLARLDRQMHEVQQAAQGARGGASGRGQANSAPGQAGRSGPEGRQGQRGSQGDGQGSGDVARLQEDFNRELQRTRDLMGRLQRAAPESGGRMTTPEQHEWSRSAPGTEAFKQDYSIWQSLAGNVTQALERAEASVAARLSSTLARDRLRAGGSERLPDDYNRRVSRYFEAIATQKHSTLPEASRKKPQ
jgi:hypothetical protein